VNNANPPTSSTQPVHNSIQQSNILQATSTPVRISTIPSQSPLPAPGREKSSLNINLFSTEKEGAMNLFAISTPAQQQIVNKKLPKNSCAFTSAMFMIAHGAWKTQFVVKSEEWGKNLVQVTKGIGTTEAIQASAIDEIVKADEKRCLEELGNHQDPFIVLQLVMTML
jgi:hypothetical protein